MKKLFKSIVGVEKMELIKTVLKLDQNKELKARRKKFYMQLLQAGDIYFDIGANIGNRIEPLIDENVQIVAVEPQAVCVQVLRKKFGSRISIVQKGVGEKEEVKEFFASNSDTTLSTFSEEWMSTVKKSGRFGDKEWGKSIKVPMTTLDLLIGEYGVPKFIKIDVEGYEAEVLKGLTKPVKYISFEYATPEFSDNISACLNKLFRLSDKIVCNYSVGEEMEFVLPKWVSFEEMKQHITTEGFIDTRFGDIYVLTNV